MFEEFEEENNSFLRDSKKRKAERDWRELEEERVKRDPSIKLDPKDKLDIFESFVTSDRPSLLKAIEDVKKLKIEADEFNKEADNEILNNVEFKQEIDDILVEPIEKKAKRKQQQNRNIFYGF